MRSDESKEEELLIRRTEMEEEQYDEEEEEEPDYDTEGTGRAKGSAKGTKSRKGRLTRAIAERYNERAKRRKFRNFKDRFENDERFRNCMISLHGFHAESINDFLSDYYERVRAGEITETAKAAPKAVPKGPAPKATLPKRVPIGPQMTPTQPSVPPPKELMVTRPKVHCSTTKTSLRCTERNNRNLSTNYCRIY